MIAGLEGCGRSSRPAHRIVVPVSASVLPAFWSSLPEFQSKRNDFSTSLWWVLSLAVILGIHSMLEYPLWYAYFLGIAAVVLGASESAATTIGKRTGCRLVRGLMLLLGWIAVANVYHDYRTLQFLHRVPPRDAIGASHGPAAASREALVAGLVTHAKTKIVEEAK